MTIMPFDIRYIIHGVVQFIVQFPSLDGGSEPQYMQGKATRHKGLKNIAPERRTVIQMNTFTSNLSLLPSKIHDSDTTYTYHPN